MLAEQPSREREAVRRFQQQIAKLQQENAQLQRDKTETEGKLKLVEAERDKLKLYERRLANAERGSRALRDANSKLQTELVSGAQRLREVQTDYQRQLSEVRGQLEQSRSSLTETVQRNERQAATLTAGVQDQEKRAALCESANRDLYVVTMDLIDHYKSNRGAWEKFLLTEPFTGVKSVRVENLLEDMRDRAQAAKVTASPAAAPVQR
ncbi:MAG: hypothetical protein ABI612_17070 [Betaproteobacteria bacterium]